MIGWGGGGGGGGVATDNGKNSKFCLAMLCNMILLIDCKGKASHHALIKLENESQKLVLIENFRKLGKQLSGHTLHALMYYIALLI